MLAARTVNVLSQTVTPSVKIMTCPFRSLMVADPSGAFITGLEIATAGPSGKGLKSIPAF